MDSKGVVVSIFYKRRTIGNAYYKNENGTIDMLNEVKEIIDNYNSNLISAELESGILAMKLFQKQDKDGSLKVSHPYLMDSTHKFLDDTYGDYGYAIISGGMSHRISVGITNKDFETNVIRASHTVKIDFDNKIISTDLYETVSLSTAIMVTGLSFDINEIPFNRLSDAILELATKKEWQTNTKDLNKYNKILE